MKTQTVETRMLLSQNIKYIVDQSGALNDLSSMSDVSNNMKRNENTMRQAKAHTVRQSKAQL